MPAFSKPKISYSYDAGKEINALRQYRDTKPGRQIPPKKPDHVLLATWNIANLGVQKRRDDDYKLLAEMISWFDIVALQELHDNLEGLRKLQKFLPGTYRAIFSDAGGNSERKAYLYDGTKISLMEKVGELGIPPKDHRHIKIPGISGTFKGFDRNPYLVAFSLNGFDFILLNVHLYFGDEGKKSVERRSLETYAVARWAYLRKKSKNNYTSNIIALGDFNLPKVEKGDAVYDALTGKGLMLPEHSSRVYSNLDNDKQYDQIAFFPGMYKSNFTGKTGVFDFDGAVFADLYENNKKSFKGYLRYYLSDHRPMWIEFKC